MLASSILVEDIYCLIFFSVEAETSEHWSLAHIYIAIDSQVGNVSVLTESKVLKFDLTIGAVYVECQILTTCFCDRYVVDYYPVFIAVTFDRNLDTTFAAGSSLVQCNLGDVSQSRCYYVRFCSLVFASIFGCLHETGNFWELSVGTCWINTYTVECKAEFLLAVEGFHVYHFVCSFTSVDFFPVGEISRVESLFLNSTYLYYLYLIEVTGGCCYYFNIALSYFCRSGFVFCYICSCCNTTYRIIVIVRITCHCDYIFGRLHWNLKFCACIKLGITCSSREFASCCINAHSDAIHC